jgi:hypothetical protein
MRFLWIPILVVSLSPDSFAKLAGHNPPLRYLPRQKFARTVVGSLAAVSRTYGHGQAITLVHILDFRTDAFPNEPVLLEVRLCGDQTRALEQATHTNLAITYNTASKHRLTGCLELLRSDPWHDDSPWQTITFQPGLVERSTHRERLFQKFLTSDGPAR